MIILLFCLLVTGFLCQAKADTNAYDNDINRCLFTRWTTASGNKNAVLKQKIKCPGRDKAQLCYGPRGTPAVAQFAVCYNKLTLTPDFTGHIVVPNIQVGGGRDDWHNEAGTYGNCMSFIQKSQFIYMLYVYGYEKKFYAMYVCWFW